MAKQATFTRYVRALSETGNVYHAVREDVVVTAPGKGLVLSSRRSKCGVEVDLDSVGDFGQSCLPDIPPSLYRHCRKCIAILSKERSNG